MRWLRQVDIWGWDKRSIMGGDRLQSYSYLLWTPANDSIITEHTLCLCRALGCTQACSHTLIQTHTHTVHLYPGPDSLAIIPSTSFPNGSWHYIKHNKGFHLLLFINPRTSAHKVHINTHTLEHTHTGHFVWKCNQNKDGKPSQCDLATEKQKFAANMLWRYTLWLLCLSPPFSFLCLSLPLFLPSIPVVHLQMSNTTKLQTFKRDKHSPYNTGWTDSPLRVLTHFTSSAHASK